jgi:hypothetical protein
MFKFKDGKIVWIQAVFGGRTEAASATKKADLERPASYLPLSL